MEGPLFKLREREVMYLLSLDFSLREIAARVGVIHRTVEHDVTRLRAKYNARDVAALRVIAQGQADILV